MRKRIIASVCFFVISFSFFGRAFTVGDEAAIRFCLAAFLLFGCLGLIWLVLSAFSSVFDG